MVCVVIRNNIVTSFWRPWLRATIPAPATGVGYSVGQSGLLVEAKVYLFYEDRITASDAKFPRFEKVSCCSQSPVPMTRAAMLTSQRFSGRDVMLGETGGRAHRQLRASPTCPTASSQSKLGHAGYAGAPLQSSLPSSMCVLRAVPASPITPAIPVG